MNHPHREASGLHPSVPLVDGDIAHEVDTVLRATIVIIAVLIASILASSAIGAFTQ